MTAKVIMNLTERRRAIAHLTVLGKIMVTQEKWQDWH